MKKLTCTVCGKTKWAQHKEGDVPSPCLPCRGGNPKRAPRPKRIKKKRSGRSSLPKSEEMESDE